MTNEPLNLDDEDIVDDRAPLLSALPNGSSYEVIMDIDTEMQQLLNDIPAFFKMTPFEVAGRYKFSDEKAKTIVRQGNDFLTIFYATRCKLHLPYARRGFTEPEYATSRDLCIQSARLIIQTESEYQHQGIDKIGERYKPLLYSMTVFMACTILLMEYCHRKVTPGHGQADPRTEICKAITMLESARSESEIASKFLDSLVTVLLKNGIAPPKRYQQQTPTTLSSDEITSSYTSTAENALPMTPLSGSQLATSAVGGEMTCTGGFAALEPGSDLNDLVKTIDQGIDVGMIEWDDIFMGLGDSAFM
ncbi:hypothetical protein N0V90_011329 [Kalmusia sp. IMI 367209]|nr:hypothetical protein N0V90_011329 [Kalmusia sp. IMI 367209]